MTLDFEDENEEISQEDQSFYSIDEPSETPN